MTYRRVQELARKFAKNSDIPTFDDDRDGRDQEMRKTFEETKIKSEQFFKQFRTIFSEIFIYHEEESYKLRDLKYNSKYLKSFNRTFDYLMEIFQSIGTDYEKTARIIKFVNDKRLMLQLLNKSIKAFATKNTSPVEWKMKLDSPEKLETDKLNFISLDKLLLLAEISQKKIESFKGILPLFTPAPNKPLIPGPISTIPPPPKLPLIPISTIPPPPKDYAPTIRPGKMEEPANKFNMPTIRPGANR